MTIHTSTSLAGALYPFWWGDKYAAFESDGGVILARIGDGASCFFQPGDDSEIIRDQINGINALKESDEIKIEAFDRAASAYDEVMAPASDSGGRTSSDGGFWYWLR